MLNKRKAALLFIFVTVLLDMVALGIIVPVFNPLVLSFTHGNYASASLLAGVMSTIFAAMQFFGSPILGTLSDRVGRRPVVLLSNLGTAFDYAILALAPTLGWLFSAVSFQALRPRVSVSRVPTSPTSRPRTNVRARTA